MINPTHLATIEHYQETGETEDDGMGGTVPVEDWVAVVEDAPCRYEPEGQPFVREDMGGRVYKEARTHWAPWTVGEMVDDGPGDQQYELNVGAGDDWRLSIEGVDGVFVIRSDPKAHSSGYNAPKHVTIELERVDATDMGA